MKLTYLLLTLSVALQSYAQDEALAPAQTTPPKRNPYGYGTRVDPPPARQAETEDPEETKALQEAMGKFLSTMMSGAGYGGEVASGDDMSSPTYGNGGAQPIGAGDLNSPYKIVPPFQKWFNHCSNKLGYGNCRFENFGIMGDSSHRARRSCHNAGEAIDVGPITCSSGRSIRPKSTEFFRFAQCMAQDTQNELQVIYFQAQGPNMIQKSDHSGHMHIQLKNCRMVYGGGGG